MFSCKPCQVEAGAGDANKGGVFVASSPGGGGDDPMDGEKIKRALAEAARHGINLNLDPMKKWSVKPPAKHGFDFYGLVLDPKTNAWVYGQEVEAPAAPEEPTPTLSEDDPQLLADPPGLKPVDDSRLLPLGSPALTDQQVLEELAKVAGLQPGPPVPPAKPVGVPKFPAPKYPVAHQPAMPPPPKPAVAADAPAEVAAGVAAAPEATAGHEGAPFPELPANAGDDAEEADADTEDTEGADTEGNRDWMEPWMRQLPNLQICPSCTKNEDQMPEIFWSQLHVASMHMHEAFLPHLQNEVTHQRPHGSMSSPLHALLVL